MSHTTYTLKQQSTRECLKVLVCLYICIYICSSYRFCLKSLSKSCGELIIAVLFTLSACAQQFALRFVYNMSFSQRGIVKQWWLLSSALVADIERHIWLALPWRVSVHQCLVCLRSLEQYHQHLHIECICCVWALVYIEWIAFDISGDVTVVNLSLCKGEHGLNLSLSTRLVVFLFTSWKMSLSFLLNLTRFVFRL